MKIPVPQGGSEHCVGSRVPEAYVYTQDRDRFRPLKRRVEVSMRDLSREDRDACNRTRMDFVVGQGSCGTGQGSVESPAKSHPPCSLGVNMEECWNRESSESWIARTWFSGNSLHNTSHMTTDPDV